MSAKEQMIHDDVSISACDLSMRAMNVLLANNVKKVSDLKRLDFMQARRFKNMGKKTIQEVMDFMDECGIINNPETTRKQEKNTALRDQFAGMAMQAMITYDSTQMCWDEFADEAYAVADAMLKAREQ